MSLIMRSRKTIALGGQLTLFNYLFSSNKYNYLAGFTSIFSRNNATYCFECLDKAKDVWKKKE